MAELAEKYDRTARFMREYFSLCANHGLMLEGPMQIPLVVVPFRHQNVDYVEKTEVSREITEIDERKQKALEKILKHYTPTFEKLADS